MSGLMEDYYLKCTSPQGNQTETEAAATASPFTTGICSVFGSSMALDISL